MSEKNRFRDEKDDFWDLADLVPSRRKQAPRMTDHNTEAVEITVQAAATADTADVPLTERPVFPHGQTDVAKPTPETVYTPAGSLLREVRIYPPKNEYTYYEQFRKQAEQLAPREGKKCPPVDFFSYMPQYTQMNLQQLGYYLWWRTCFRRGTCLPVAYSYLLLYLYELINLDERHQDPTAGQECMYRLWLSYREQYPRLDALVREWLCDYSLLHQLPPPKMDATCYRLLLSGCRLKEFYVSADVGGDAMRRAILLFCNNYDYTKSKFYRPDTAADYDRVLDGAIGVALAHMNAQSGAALTDRSGVSTVTRDSFAGAVCSYRLKRRIEVDFTSFSHTHELRYVMTDVLKYAENALRAVMGVKSRLSIYAVSVPLRAELDAYLKKALPVRRSKGVAAKAAEMPDYERRYELPAVEISAERAAAIEAESWQTTKRLVEAFGGEIEEITPETGVENTEKNGESTPAATASGGARDEGAQKSREGATAAGTATQAATATEGSSPLGAALGDLADFLPLALTQDRAAQRAFAASKGCMLDAIVDKINTVAGDMLGDILLEESNGAYTIIEDYLDELYQEGVLKHGKA